MATKPHPPPKGIKALDELAEDQSGDAKRLTMRSPHFPGATRMPQYYFDCHHAGCPEQCLGHDLVDHAAAHKMAIEYAGEILQHEAQALVDGHDLNVTVSDENHLALFVFRATSIAAPSMPAR